MPFLGTTPTQGFVSSFPKQSFTPNGSTTVFTLTNPVASANDLEVFVGNVRQEPTAAYSAAGTTLTMTEAPASGLNFYVINKSFAQVTTNTPDGSVSTAKILDDAVTGAKIENNPTIAGNLTVSGTSTNTGLITASAGVAIGGTGTANTLDDYEEGSWTPTLVSAGRTYGYSDNVGLYTKIGRMVHISGRIDVNSVGGSGNSTVSIQTLPFATSTGHEAGTTPMQAQWGSATSRLMLYLGTARTYMGIYENPINGNYVTLKGNEVGSNDSLIFSISYMTD